MTYWSSKDPEMAYFFENQWDAFGYTTDVIDLDNGGGGGWGGAFTKDYDTAYRNFIEGKAATPGQGGVALRQVGIQETRTNPNWLVDRQKEAFFDQYGAGESVREGNWFTDNFVGSTFTLQNGIEFKVDSDLGDKYRFAAYHSNTIGDEKLFNVNTTTFINQSGKASTTVDYSLNLYFYKLKANLTDIGIEQEIGIGPYMQTSLGMSVANGYSYSGSIFGYGLQGSARPGGYTLIGVGVAAGIIFFPEVTIPVLSSQ